MGEQCEFAGCAGPAVESVPTLDRPSSVSPDHPDYKPARTTIQVCSEHLALAKLRAAAFEHQIFNGDAEPPTQP